ncbi:hypothetical protein GIB67_003251 [Kingdonia uniflora]|uniref:Uncharacterized protein n=1 Tax=Kingdonia uniflora TaxID=39325 RepID=A0A7J7LXJ8_9MAGN|nr:hypothetical protein GIB67_003251 [Kingdonia uniflora]
MVAAEETSSLFPIFILTIMALPLVPYTISKLCCAASKKAKIVHCQCSVFSSSGKYQKSMHNKFSNFSTCSNLTLVLLWVIMGILVYYIKHISQEMIRRCQLLDFGYFSSSTFFLNGSSST